jgi:uncharacterized protein (DUF2237 family)
MNRVYARLAAAALAAVLVFGATSADAANKNTVGAALHDCGQGHDPLAGHYSVKVLQTALHDLHTNSLQYTTCADALQNAINSQLSRPRTHRGGKVTLPGQGGPAKPTHNVVKQRVNRVKKLGGAPFLLPSGQSVTPGAVTVHSASFLSSLPTPLLIVLAALLAAVAAVGGRALHQLVRTRRSH